MAATPFNLGHNIDCALLSGAHAGHAASTRSAVPPAQLHKTMMKSFKYALVWGQSARHRPQRVGKDHILMDEDIVQIVKRI